MSVSCVNRRSSWCSVNKHQHFRNASTTGQVWVKTAALTDAAHKACLRQSIHPHSKQCAFTSQRIYFVNKTISPRGPFNSCSGAFDDIAWSSSADGVCLVVMELWILNILIGWCKVNTVISQLTKQSHLKVFLVSVLELLIISHDHHDLHRVMWISTVFILFLNKKKWHI